MTFEFHTRTQSRTHTPILSPLLIGTQQWEEPRSKGWGGGGESESMGGRRREGKKCAQGKGGPYWKGWESGVKATGNGKYTPPTHPPPPPPPTTEYTCTIHHSPLG